MLYLCLWEGTLKKLILAILILCTLTAYNLTAQDLTDAEAGTEITADAESPAEDTLLIDEATLQNETALPPVASVSPGDYVRMVLSLLAVIGAIYGVFYLMKRFGTTVPPQQSRFLNVHASQTLGKGKALHLVQVGHQVFLVGASDSQVNLISKIEDKETLDSLSLEKSETLETPGNNFTDMLRHSLFGRRETGNSNIGHAMSASVNSIKSFTDRLKDLSSDLRSRRND